jgi:putative MATE family efflux protein
MNVEKRKDMLGDDNIKKLLFRLSVPATIGMIVMALYNLVDAIFIGRGVGAIAIGGLAIVFPLQMIIMAVTQMFGTGSASIISRSLGAKNIQKAKLTFSSVYVVSFIFSVLIVSFSLIFDKQILTFFGATENILPYARDYFRIIILGTFFFSFDMISNNIIRSEGFAKVAMFSMFTGAILNIILDPIFIFVFHLGIKGAAIATVFSQFSMLVYIFFFYNSGKSVLHVSDLRFVIKPKIVSEIMAVGSASLFRMIMGSVLVVIINNSLKVYGGDLAIAAYGIINRLIRFIFMPLFGIAQGLQPVLGYNFGAKRYAKAKESIVIAMKNATFITTLGFVLIMLFSYTFISVFTKNQELILLAGKALKYIVIALPIVGFQVITSTIYLAIGKPKPALILTLARQLIFLVPLLLILPKFWNLNGIWFSSPISDFLSSVLALWFLAKLYSKYKHLI